MSSTRIPVIDISSFTDGTDQEGVARAVAEACRDTGFFVITGHGVDPELTKSVRSAATDFFRQPVDEKNRSSGGSSVGYSPLQAESLAKSLGDDTPPDLKEAYTIAQVDATDDAYFTDESAAFFFPDNVWPQTPSEFEHLSTSYYRAMGQLSELMFQVFAVALDLPADHFAPVIDKHFSYFRYVYYPVPDGPVQPGQLRAGAHTDYGSFTFVNFNDAPGGLQVNTGEDTWIDVPVIADSFVVNLGDLMEQWTNDRWRSTLHRVVAPDEGEWSQSERLSLVFFHEPNYDTMIEALPTCVSADDPARHAPISCGEHLASKVMAQQDLGDDGWSE
ncbi:MAG: isopenicillin N synthase-like dioxygenase [Ilumatobacter sp.]|jgi:isopenicillin N synthase-like dioxygenase